MELEGIVVGQDPIPLIEDVQGKLQEIISPEEKEIMVASIRGNKHNNVSTTYYLLLKKIERESGKNIFFERVTKEKRNYNSMGNLKNSAPRGQSLHNTTFYKNASSNSYLDYSALMNQTSAGFHTQQSTTSKQQ